MRIAVVHVRVCECVLIIRFPITTDIKALTGHTFFLNKNSQMFFITDRVRNTRALILSIFFLSELFAPPSFVPIQITIEINCLFSHFLI